MLGPLGDRPERAIVARNIDLITLERGVAAQHAQAIRPHVLSFTEVATSTAPVEFAIEEIAVPESSPLVGETLKSARLRDRFGVIVVGSRTKAHEMVFNPPADYAIHGGEVLIVLGKRESLTTLREAVTGT